MNQAFDGIINYHKNEEDDYYFILGCNENSTIEQITAEYKSHVMSCHPDKHQNDDTAHDRFSKLSRAKDTLLDPVKRKEYDKWRHSAVAIPFETWQSLAHVKTSLHWGYCKEQVAIDQKANNQFPCRSVSPSCSMAEQSKFSQDVHEKFKFTVREKSTETKNMSQGVEWNRDTSNPLLQKFRNYEI